jgi:hypothetical protein
LAHFLVFDWASLFISLVLLWAKCNSAILLLFWPNYDVFLYLSYNHLNLPKLWKLLASNPYLCCFGEFHSNVGGVRFDLRTANTHALSIKAPSIPWESAKASIGIFVRRTRRGHSATMMIQMTVKAVDMKRM